MDFDGVKKYLFKRLAKELSNNLFYHGMHHTCDVVHVAEHLAKAENITGDDFTVVMTAALFHDSGFLIQYNDNEPIACELARKILPQYDYSQSQIDHICEMILATSIPQCPRDHLAEVLCDADLSYLGTDGYYSISETLKMELEKQGLDFENTKWIDFQLNFLTKHRFFTDTARELHEAQKQEYILELKDLLKD